MVVGIAATYGSVIGIPLLISIYGGPAAITVLIAISMIVSGVVLFKKVAGKVILASGIVVWLILGMLGLGHGG